MKHKYIFYKEEDMFIGYLEEFPDYRTQGTTLEELENNLKDIYQELNSGKIPHVLHVSELEIG
ncbi:type II toxin-antitoxin system HicB family antitoxin [bacterium]|nr:type II toxin-antitoxin system HicB family antitoxin [bacterium]